MTHTTNINIDLRQVILAIETTVSLVGINDTNHGKRVGYIANQLGQKLGFSQSDIQFAFELGLLHDCGVSTDHMHVNLVHNFDWEDAYIHCDKGYKLLKDFEPLSKFATPILYHHTAWKELLQKQISDYDSCMANLIFLADRIDVMAAAHYESDILLVRQDIVDSLRKFSGSYFNPEFVQAFIDIQDHESFWITLESRHITSYVWDFEHLSQQQDLTLEQVKQLSLILAYIVDQKSSFTAQHSVRVADVAKFIALSYGLSQEQCDKIEIAGLLHDIGKLNIPDDILEKEGPLNNIERATMNRHSYETYEILRRIDGIGDIARWAAFHHEGLNGRGYPFHPEEQELSLEARIIAVADVFQALVQDRPYRKGMKLEQVLAILKENCESGKLDIGVVVRVEDIASECYSIASGLDQSENQAFLSAYLA